MKIDDFQPDPWQSEVLAHQGNIILRTGRQVGKSTIVSRKTYKFATENEKVLEFIEKGVEINILCIAASVRQAGFIYDKITALFERDNEQLVEAAKETFRTKNSRFPTYDELRRIQQSASLYKDLPTKTKITLKTGVTIYCLPAGKTGIFIMGLTIDLLVADEAAFIPEVVWNAILPMVMISRKRGLGLIWLLSIPFAKSGYYHSCETDDTFRFWHVTSEDCPRADKNFLAKEKRRMTKAEYARTYLGEYADEFNQLFPTELIMERSTFMSWEEKEKDLQKVYYLGVDIARYGGDENAFVVAEMDRRQHIRIVRIITTARVSITDTVGRVLALQEAFGFRKIFIDDAGVGGGAMDLLLEKLGRKVVGLNNARRSIDRDGRQKGILKEDLYSNALVLMEGGKLEMISDLGLQKSLKSMTFEYTSEKNLKIGGSYSHIAEAFVRAAWCIRERGLRPYVM